MGAAADPAELFEITLERALEQLGGSHGVIMESDMNKEKLKVRSLHNLTDSTSRIEISQQVLRVVLRAGRCVFCPDVAKDSRFSKLAENARRPIESFVASPIVCGSTYFGFIYLDSEKDSKRYDYVALRTLFILASHLGGLLQPRTTYFEHQPSLAAGAHAGVS